MAGLTSNHEVAALFIPIRIILKSRCDGLQRRAVQQNVVPRMHMRANLA